MTRYDSGRALEYRVRDLLTELGFFVVRSAGSKSPVDLIALARRDDEVPIEQQLTPTTLPCPVHMLLVQCKRGGSLPPAEWNALYDLAIQTGGVPILAEYTPRKPVMLWRLTGRKESRVRRQPLEVWSA